MEITNLYVDKIYMKKKCRMRINNLILILAISLSTCIVSFSSLGITSHSVATSIIIVVSDILSVIFVIGYIKSCYYLINKRYDSLLKMIKFIYCM